MLKGISRGVSPHFQRCQLTFLKRAPINQPLAVRQHHDYCNLLRRCGVILEELPAAAEFPDCCFIEDAAMVLDDLVVVCRMGAAGRRGEEQVVEAALRKIFSGRRRLKKISAPGTLDGGDVLVAGKRVFVGGSSRSNRQGIEQFSGWLAALGYRVQVVPVERCLHLKSAVTALDAETLLVNSGWVDTAEFAGFRLVNVPPAEPAAANVLRQKERLYLPAEFPRTAELLRSHGYAVETVPASEVLKAEGGMTCCSLIWQEDS